MSGQQIVLERDGHEQSVTVNDPETVLRQVNATRRRPLWTLPESWFEPHVAEAMSVWIVQNDAALSLDPDVIGRHRMCVRCRPLS